MHRKIMLQRCFHASIVADIRPKLRYCTYGGDMSEGRQRSSASDKKKKVYFPVFFPNKNLGARQIFLTCWEARTGRDPRWDRLLPHNHYK